MHYTNTDTCLFKRNNWTSIAHVDNYLIFHKSHKLIKDMILSLKDEFQLTDEGDLETFLGVSLQKHIHKNCNWHSLI